MGHEYCGAVVEVGSAVKTVRPGQFVVGSFRLSDNTCPHCQFGFQSSCENRQFMSAAQAPYARVPLANGTLVATPEMPADDLIPSLLATSDVLGTGWFAADAAGVQEGCTAVVVGDGAVGLMGVLAAKLMGAARIITMSRHKSRQDLALECVGTQESMTQAINCARPGGKIGFVGVPHGVQLDGRDMFFQQKSLLGGPAPVRRFLSHLMDLVLSQTINPGKVFDLELPLEDVAEGYRSMDDRRAIKTLLRL
jgi:threonine dehydrogenase-like Zn-dependent dehydrogenase